MRDPHRWRYFDYVTYQVRVCETCGTVHVTEFPGGWKPVWNAHVTDRCSRVA